MTINRFSLFAAISLAVALPAFAQSSADPSKPLTGGDVLDYDGQILRGALEQQVNAASPAVAQPATPVAPVVPARKRDITIDVYGVDASAIGGPVENHARIRYDNRYYTVSVRSQVGPSLRVFRITDTGTTLAGLHGKKPYTVFLPRMDEQDADESRSMPDASAESPVPPSAPATGSRGNTQAHVQQPVAQPQPPMLTAPAVIASPAPVAGPAPTPAPTPRIASTSNEPASPPHLVLPGLPTAPAAH